MNYLLASAFFIISFIGFSQQDSLVITTDISVDSIYYNNQKLEFLAANDSVLKTTIERSLDTMNTRLVMYSGAKTYETNLPANPETAFPGEWMFRDPGFPVTIHASIKKGHFVILSASGSALNMMMGLGVFTADGDFIRKESCGVYLVKEPRRKRKKSK